MTTTKIYYAIKEANYNHEVIGIFSSAEIAEDWLITLRGAIQAKFNGQDVNKHQQHREFDGYHTYSIYQCDLDSPCIEVSNTLKFNQTSKLIKEIR